MTSSGTVKVADFSSREYWQHRLARESSFEWLQPPESMLPAIETELWTRRSATLLHIGSGSSDLSNHLRNLLSLRKDLPAEVRDGSLILNVDFSPAAIELGRKRELEEFGDNRDDSGMRWAVVDLLDWQSFKCVWEDHCGKAFDIIIDKSCTDALACSPDIGFPRNFNEESSTSLPSQVDAADVQMLPPASVLAIHLAALAQPGAAWIAVSYSGDRFDFLRDGGNPASLKWSVELVQKLSVAGDDGSTAEGTTVHRPEICHFLYLLRRSPS